jgi:cobalt-zinc-cadmium efflux system outer membrane protein
MYRFLLPLIAAACSWSAFAQNVTASPYVAHALQQPASTQILTLEQALGLAMRANPDLSAAALELDAVQASVMQADTLPNPTLETLVEDTRKATRETTVQISQPLELGGQRAARTRAAERGRDAAASELVAKRAEVQATVITAFFDTLAAQERLRLAQDAAELAKRATTVASRRVAAGKVSPVEETKARVAESSVRLEHAQARSELASARKRLSALWGSATPDFDHVEGSLATLPVLPDMSGLEQRMTNAPALIRARHEVDRRQALAQLERARRVPDVTVTLGVKRSEEQGRNLTVVGFSLPLPIFDSNRGNVLESLRRTDKARDELSAAVVRIDVELAQAWEQLSLSRHESETLRDDIVPGAQSAYDAATKGFEFGKFGFLDVLDAQRTLLQAKSQYLKTLSDAHRAAADIDRILGDRIHGDQTSGDTTAFNRIQSQP